MYKSFEKFRNLRDMKDLDWYDRNSVLLANSNWRDLKNNDILIYAYNESMESGVSLKEVIIHPLEVYGKHDIDLSIFTNFELIDKDTKTYSYDIYDVYVTPNQELGIKDKRMRHDGYSMKDDINSHMGFFLIQHQFTKDFLNYSQLPNTK